MGGRVADRPGSPAGAARTLAASGRSSSRARPRAGRAGARRTSSASSSASATRSTCCWSRCCARGTSCSRTCRASARRCWPSRVARTLGCTLPAHPVHARPAAERRHRRLVLQPARAGVRVPARADLRPGRAGRRDQPRDAADAVGAARGDGGAAGHRRGRDAPAAAAVPGAGDAESDRARGHLPAAGGAARPLPAAAVASATRSRRTRSDIVRRFRRASPLDELPPVVAAEELVAMQRAGARACTSREPVEDYICAARARDARARPASSWAPARAPRWRCIGPPRRWPRSAGAASSSPTTSSGWRRRC